MHISISVLFLTLISTCTAYIAHIDAGRQHENASSDFIRAEKCSHCAHHMQKGQNLSGDVGFQKSAPVEMQVVTGTDLDADPNKPSQISNSTSYNNGSQLEWSNWQSGKQTNDSVEGNVDEEIPDEEIPDDSALPKDKGSSIFSRWFSPEQISQSVKYAFSNFLPESPVDTISKNLNSSRHNSSTFSSMYPIVLEGISVLANSMKNEEDKGELEDMAAKNGSIVSGLMNTINQALNFGNLSANEVSNSTQIKQTKGGNAIEGIEKLIESGFLKNAVSLVGQILKNDDVQNITSELMNKSNTADVKILFDKVNNVLQTTVFGLENALKHKDLFLAMAKPTNGSTSPINLANIVGQYISKNGTSIGGDLSKNPMLQSAFVSKALSKSPVAHLGALDDDIKKLVTSSMEKAMSRIRIGENGEIQMSDGMRKMLTKMVKEHEKSKNETSSSSDSIMDMVQLVINSGKIKEITPVDNGPVQRRNVTHHSPLHKKFQLKYGKNGGNSILQYGLHHTLLVMLSLAVVPMI